MALTKKQEGAIQRQGHLVRACLKSVREHRFEVGTILIKKERTYVSNIGKCEWVTETFSPNRTAFRKYKVTAVDEFGIPFIRKILNKGILHKELKYLGNHDCDHVRYEVDPELQFHVILGNEEEAFDPQDSYKKERYGDKK